MSRSRKALVLLDTKVKQSTLPQNTKIKLTFQLRKLIEGTPLSYQEARPLPSVGPNCYILAINDRKRKWRVIYRCDPEAILIAEIFQLTTTRTPRRIVELCKKRYESYEALGPNTKKKRREEAGIAYTRIRDLLGLTEDELAYFETKRRLAEAVAERRLKRKFSKRRLAEAMGSSPARIDKLEAGDPSVSADLLIRTMYKLGASRKELARVIGHNPMRLGGVTVKRSVSGGVRRAAARLSAAKRRPNLEDLDPKKHS